MLAAAAPTGSASGMMGLVESVGEDMRSMGSSSDMVVPGVAMGIDSGSS